MDHGPATTPVRRAVTLRGVKKSFPLSHGRDLEGLNIEQLTLVPASYTVLRGPSGCSDLHVLFRAPQGWARRG